MKSIPCCLFLPEPCWIVTIGLSDQPISKSRNPNQNPCVDLQKHTKMLWQDTHTNRNIHTNKKIDKQRSGFRMWHTFSQTA
jgi:hypothetical protein